MLEHDWGCDCGHSLGVNERGCESDFPVDDCESDALELASVSDRANRANNCASDCEVRVNGYAPRASRVQ